MSDKFATKGLGKKVAGVFALRTGYIRQISSWKVLVVSWDIKANRNHFCCDKGVD